MAMPKPVTTNQSDPRIPCQSSASGRPTYIKHTQIIDVARAIFNDIFIGLRVLLADLAFKQSPDDPDNGKAGTPIVGRLIRVGQKRD